MHQFLQSQAHKHAGAWLSVVPSTNFGLQFDEGDYLLLTNFHLGLPLLPAAAAGTLVLIADIPWMSSVTTSSRAAKQAPGDLTTLFAMLWPR